MNGNLKSLTGRAINSGLGMVNLKLVRCNTPYTDYRDYIPFAETLTGANEAGLSVGDYIDVRHNIPGATQKTSDQMAALGVFKDKIERV